MTELHYPTIEHIIEFNHLALALIKAKKADRPSVLSRQKLSETIEECQKTKGDVYDKATVLLVGITRKHPFASGNRRTAFLVMVDFLYDNGVGCALKNEPENARVLLGIREDFYTREHIKEWIKHGKIHPFQR